MLQKQLPNTNPPLTVGQWYANVRPMLVRILSGVVGAALYALILFIPNGNGLPFALGIALFSVIGSYELYEAVKRQGGQPSEGLGYFACIIFQLYAWPHGGQSFIPYLPAALMLLVVVALLIEIVKRQPRPILNVGATLLGAIYVGWFFSYLTLLRGLNHHHILIPPIHGTTQGEWLVFFVSGTTWLSDSGALFAGRALGRHKLAPRVSPAKTWEGSIGGLVVAVLGGLLFGKMLHLPLNDAAALAILCGFVGQIGDLCESALKRDLGVKDTGAVIPGHGGILDRIDSLLFSAPIAYYFILFFLARNH
jgi:phosphatidate cytidylyltransferase